MRYRLLLAAAAFLSSMPFQPSGMAADVDAVQAAIDKGVAYLRSKQSPGTGMWAYHEHEAGATALAGLTLLECGVDSDDAAVRKAASSLRPRSIQLTDTYSIALAILFFDRLGASHDVPLIQSLAVRLLAGQNASGGWTYSCPPLPREEIRRLTTLIRSTRHQTGGLDEGSTAASRPESAALPREIQRQLKLLNPLSPGPQLSDNSNTKFATLALWVARRHGMPVSQALSLVESRFRTTQNSDGGWGYLPPHARGPRGLGRTTISMTCAGLLGLAIGQGAARDVSLNTGPRGTTSTPKGQQTFNDPVDDPAVRKALLLVARIIDTRLDADEAVVPLYEAKEGDDYYLLWALERVAVAFSLQTIGERDWYAWGSDLLLSRQRRDGSWVGLHSEGGVDTCFALLFLRRVNLTKDLTVTLKGQALRSRGEDKRRESANPEAVNAKRHEPAETSAPQSRSAPDAQPAPGAVLPKSVSESPRPEVLDRSLPAAPPDFASLVNQLTSDLSAATGLRQHVLIERYRDAKGVEYTQALAESIPKLGASAVAEGRAALAERLARMTTATLVARLKDENPEIRRAAALACAMKDAQPEIPQIIPLLNDPVPIVVHAAHAALKSLSGRDFGPQTGANREDREKAVSEWRKWWDTRHRP